MAECPRQCGAVLTYSEERDAYYCSACDVWIESACGDPQCCYNFTRGSGWLGRMKTRRGRHPANPPSS